MIQHKSFRLTYIHHGYDARSSPAGRRHCSIDGAVRARLHSLFMSLQRLFDFSSQMSFVIRKHTLDTCATTVDNC
jgi:hypothetical protein